MGMVVAPYPFYWAGCHIHANGGGGLTRQLRAVGLEGWTAWGHR